MASLNIRDGRITDPVIVWDEKNILIDGYTRKLICDKLLAEGLQLPELQVFRKSFATRDEAVKYVFTRCQTMRLITAARRALCYLEANDNELARLKAQAKKNQGHGLDSSDGNGENQNEKGLEQCAKTLVPPGNKSKGEAINLRLKAAKAAGVNEKDMAAAMKLKDILSDSQLTPQDKSVLEARRGHWESGMIGYRIIEMEIQKIKDKRRAASARKNVLNQALPPLDKSATLDRIVNCDNLEGLKGLEDDSVALFFTSPPYPLANYEYAGQSFYDGDYQKMLDSYKARFAEAYRAQKKGGRFVVQIDAVFAKHGPSGMSVSLPIYADILRLMGEVGYIFLDEICWYKQKTPGKNGHVGWGTYGSPRAPKIRRAHEYVLVFFKDTPVLEGNDKDITITAQEFQHFTISHWYFPPETHVFRADSDGTKHPCPFPESLPYRCIQLYTRKGDLVVDPWNGAGTTTYVAHALGRRYIGFDIVPQFVEIAQKRIADVEHLTPEQRVAKLRLFKSPPDERADGYGKRKPENSRAVYGRRHKFVPKIRTIPEVPQQ